MSFGWSAGDIVSAIKLVNQIITCVNSTGGARDHFQELESELGGLLKALKEIADLASLPDQIPEIVALKFAACLCEETLKRFYEKIKPFNESLGASSRQSKVKAAPRMVRWELLVKKDVPEFRTFLVAHVGSLNVRLNTALLKLGAKMSADSREHHLEQLRASDAIGQQLSSHSQLIVEKIAVLAQYDSAPKLESLFAVATNIWKAQNEMMEMFSKAMLNIPPPDLDHTWAQAPVKFEDALGRIMPVPSEYDWDKFEAIIQAQFRSGPGELKVLSGEYELFMGMTSITPSKSKEFRPLPGSKITMTFILGQYNGSERCPRLGCRSRSFKDDNYIMSGRTCLECHSWFRKSGAMLPKPLKPPARSLPASRIKNIEYKDEHSTQDRSYNDRKAYKNLSIYIAELPPTPKRFREKYTRSDRPPIVIYGGPIIDPEESLYKKWQDLSSKSSNQPPNKTQPYTQSLPHGGYQAQGSPLLKSNIDEAHKQLVGLLDQHQRDQSPEVSSSSRYQGQYTSYELVHPARYQSCQSRYIPPPTVSAPSRFKSLESRYVLSTALSAHPLMEPSAPASEPILGSIKLQDLLGSPANIALEAGSHVQAIFNYDANDPGELTFDKGDVILVIALIRKDRWEGRLEKNGLVGIFLAKYVEKFVPPPVVAGSFVKAITNHDAAVPDELKFKKGDIIIVLEPVYKGWWKGSLNGQVGIFHLNHVENLFPLA